jgi:hypothetical protein
MARTKSFSTWTIASLLASATLMVCCSQGRSTDPVEVKVENADFSEWTDGNPVGWQIQVGASNGAESPRSKIAKIGGPALLLSGDNTVDRAIEMLR